MANQCNDCVRGEFGTIKKLVFWIFFLLITGGLLNSWAVFASSDKNSVQDSRITANEVQGRNRDIQLTRIQLDIKELISISHETLTAIKTHEAKGNK